MIVISKDVVLTRAVNFHLLFYFRHPLCNRHTMLTSPQGAVAFRLGSSDLDVPY